MPTREIGPLTTEQEIPVEQHRLDVFAATLTSLTPEAAEQEALQKVITAAVEAESDPYMQENIKATADILQWTFWGSVGDPLPRGLAIDNVTADTTKLLPAFPLTKHTYEQSIEILRKHGYNDAYPTKPWVASENDELQRQLSEMEYDSKSMQYLRTLAEIEPTKTSVYDAFQDQMRHGQVRDEVLGKFGQDVFARNVRPEDSGAWHNAKTVFSRTIFAEDPPQKIIDQDAYSLEATAQKLTVFFQSVDPEATNIITRAYDSYDLPDHLNNKEAEKHRIALLDLSLRALEKLDGPFPLPATKATFLDVTASLLMKGRSTAFRNGGVKPEEMRAIPTWQDFVDWRLASMQAYHKPHFGDVLAGLDTYYTPSNATLLAIRQPEIGTRGEQPKLVTAPLGAADKAQLEIEDYTSDDKRTTISFLSKEYQEKQEESPVATMIECVRPTWPEARRLIQARKVYEGDEQLPTHSDEADIALFISQADLVDDGYQPAIAGFGLIAADPSKNRYYYKYNRERDPHVGDIALDEIDQQRIAEAAHSIGMFDMAKGIAEAKSLSVRSLSTLIQEYSYHGFPDKKLLSKDQVLIADARTLDDLRTFVTPQGLYCGQCSGGARLTQLLLDKGRYSLRTKAIGGLVWEGGSSTITTGAHRQTEVDKIIVDTSLTPKWRKQFPLRASKNARGIAISSSGSQLGCETGVSAIIIEPRESVSIRAMRWLFTPTVAPEIGSGFISAPELLASGPIPAPTPAELFRARRATSRTDRILAGLAVEHLADVSPREIALAITLGEQALYAAHTNPENASEQINAYIDNVQNQAHQTALEVLEQLLPERKQAGKEHKTLLYGRTAKLALKLQAKQMEPADAEILNRAAHILHLLKTADI